MEEKFIDSNVFVAAYNTTDSLHKKALKELELVQRPYLVHEYVALETATVLMIRVDKLSANRFIEDVLHNADFTYVASSSELFKQVAHTFLQTTTKLSFTDAALLSLSTKYSILSFDETLNKAIKKSK